MQKDDIGYYLYTQKLGEPQLEDDLEIISTIDQSLSDHIRSLKLKSPELALLWRLITMALEDAGFIRNPGRARQVTRENWRDAIDWIFPKKTKEATFPEFASLLESFGLDSEFFLSKLKTRKCNKCKKLIRRSFCLCK